jgi:hypothetical protein
VHPLVAAPTPVNTDSGVRIGAAYSLPPSDDSSPVPSYPLTLLAVLGVICVGASALHVLYRRWAERDPEVARRHQMEAHTVVLRLK